MKRVAKVGADRFTSGLGAIVTAGSVDEHLDVVANAGIGMIDTVQKHSCTLSVQGKRLILAQDSHHAHQDMRDRATQQR